MKDPELLQTSEVFASVNSFQKKLFFITSGVFDPPLYFYLSSYSGNLLKIYKRALVAYWHFKALLSQTSARSEIYQWGRFVELGHFDKHFVRNKEITNLDGNKTFFKFLPEASFKLIISAYIVLNLAPKLLGILQK